MVGFQGKGVADGCPRYPSPAQEMSLSIRTDFTKITKRNRRVVYE